MDNETWFRGDGRDRTRLSRQIAEEGEGGKQDLFDALYLGTAALRVMRGIANSGEVTQVIAQMIADCEIDVQRSAQTLLACVDPASSEARAAHFSGRVAAAMIGRLNEYVMRGNDAADTINPRT